MSKTPIVDGASDQEVADCLALRLLETDGPTVGAKIWRALESIPKLKAELTAAKEKIAEQERELGIRQNMTPITRFHNICRALEQDKQDSPYSAESWDELIAESKANRKRAEAAEAQIKALLQDAKRYKAWQRYWFDGEGDELNEAINSANTPEEMNAVLDRQAAIDAVRKK